MNSHLILLGCVTSSLLICQRQVLGHGTPINSLVLSTGQVAVFDGYEPAVLESIAGSDIFADEPGIGISSTVNGFTETDRLDLNVVQGLHYWDTFAVVPTTATVVIDWPDSGGTSPVQSYQVTAQSGYQTGMVWGTYRPAAGNGSWDAHGDYALEPANPVTGPASGIYGVVLQLAAPGYIASEPFLLPLVYDPAETLGATNITAGIAALQQAVLPLPAADFNRDSLVDALDLVIWKTGLGMLSGARQVEGDATDDDAITGNDFLTWQRYFSDAADPRTLSTLTTVPEPTAFLLAALVGIVGFTQERFLNHE